MTFPSLQIKTGLAKASALGAGLLVAIAATPAHAANFNGTILDIKAPSFSATVGDKIYSNFTGFEGLADTDNVQISDGGANHTLIVSNAAGWNPGTYAFSYSVNVIGSNKLFAYGASATSSIFGPPAPAGTVNLTGASGIVSKAVNAGIAGPAFYAPNPSSDTFMTMLIVTGGKVTAFDNTLTQTFDDTARTPGPLSILGAGAAFGFSRKLRKRVKASA